MAAPIVWLGIGALGAWLLRPKADPLLAFVVGAEGDKWAAGPSLQGNTAQTGGTVTYSQVQALDAAADAVEAAVAAWWKGQSPPSGAAVAFKTKWDAYYIELQAWVAGGLSGLPYAQFAARQNKLTSLSGEFAALQEATTPAPTPGGGYSAPAPVATAPVASVPIAPPAGQGGGLAGRFGKLGPLAPAALVGVGVALIAAGASKRR